MDREELLNFIADLAGPAGPEVFAGYGSGIARRISENPFDYYAVIGEWGSRIDVGQVFPVILDVMRNPPDSSFLNNFYGRFTDRWNETVSDLVRECADRNEPEVRRLIAERETDPRCSGFVREVEAVLSSRE